MSPPTQSLRATQPKPLLARLPFRALRIIVLLLRTLVARTIGPALFWARGARANPRWTPAQANAVAMMREFFHFVWATHDATNAVPAQKPDAACSAGFTLIPAAPAARFVKTARGDANVEPRALSGCWYPAPPPQGYSGRVILHFHGGGYTSGDWRPWMSGPGALRLHEATGAVVLCPGYRKSSADGQHFPAQLQDAISSYEHVLTLGVPATRIVLSGDSAGGNLTLALMRYIHDEHTLPLPAAALLVSPWLDLTKTTADLAALPEARTDFLPPGYLEYAASCLIPSNVDPAHAYISPGLRPFRLGVPVWVEIGEGEMFRDDVSRWAADVEALGDDVVVRLIRDGTHDVFWCAHLLKMEAAADESARDVARFLDSRHL